jgi:ATP-dependent DNA helicase DinG
MNDNFYAIKSTVIFSSATLTVGGKFHFMRERLGLRQVEAARVQEINVGSSFDFDHQVLFAIPMFMPEPDDHAAFTRQFSKMAISVLEATQGRGMVLYTSYRMLNDSQAEIREALGRQGIRLLAQGIDGERNHITGIFERDIHSVLLGTQSFWEGVDVVGESLSCLILAKLPFHVFTEPIIAARCELLRAQGRDPFKEYTLPSAVIRLKQGFGRLIRTRTDRGIIIVADRRLASRGYGRDFLNSLPTKAKMYVNAEQMVADAEAFFAE